MERSERSSTGRGSGVATPATGRAAPGHAHGVAEGSRAAPPDEPDDRDDDAPEVDAADSAEVGEERAGPWVPDADLMKAFGLELAETEEAGAARVGPGGAIAAAERASCPTSDGGPPWW
jgi:hypothetical protein